MKIESFVILFLLNFVKPQRPFYGVNKPEGYNFGTLQELPQTYQYVSNNDVVDTDSIIRPILSPVERMFEMADQSRKMIDYAEKYEEKKKASMFDPDSFLEALGLKPTTTTKAPTLMEKLFNPFIQPFKKEFERMAKDSPFKSILPSSTLPPTLLNQDGPRRHEANPEVKAYTNIQKLASAFQIDPNFEPLKPLKPPPSIFPFVENSNSPITKSRPIKILEKFFGKEEEKDIFGFPKQDAIDLRNPFTANPLISMFTTQKPKVSVDDVIDLLPKPLKPSFPSLKPDELLKFHQLLPTPKLPNPFENPLLPKSGNKLAEQLKPFLPKISPLSNLLESFGEYAKPQDEIQIGRDKTISILGMPIGKKDGLSLSPSTGLSYGKKNMLGPIAVNDHYNVKWDFFDKFKNIIQDTSDSFGIDAMIAKMMYKNKKF